MYGAHRAPAHLHTLSHLQCCGPVPTPADWGTERWGAWGGLSRHRSDGRVWCFGHIKEAVCPRGLIYGPLDKYLILPGPSSPLPPPGFLSQTCSKALVPDTRT